MSFVGRRNNMIGAPFLLALVLATGLSSCLAPNGNFTPWGPACANDTNYNDTGSGTAGDPFQICTAEQIQSLANTPGAWSYNFQLESDIDMGGATLAQPIGYGTSFSGVFDGQDHTISNVNVSEGPGPVGFFGQVGSSGNSAAVQNLTFKNLTVSATGDQAGAIGVNYGLISNVRVLNSTISGSQLVGGIAGVNAGQIRHVVVGGSTSITGTSIDIGGIVGALQGTSSSPFYQLSDAQVGDGVTVSGGSTSTSVGGLVGLVLGYSSAADPVTDSWVGRATVIGNSGVGGLIGELCPSSCPASSIMILNSYSLAQIQLPYPSSTDVGGAIGQLGGAGAPIVASVYSAGTIQVPSGSAGHVGGLVGLLSGGQLVDSFSAETLIPNGTDYVVGNISGGSTSNLYYSSATSCTSGCTNNTSATIPAAGQLYSGIAMNTILGLGGFEQIPWGSVANSYPMIDPPQMSGSSPSQLAYSFNIPSTPPATYTASVQFDFEDSNTLRTAAPNTSITLQVDSDSLCTSPMPSGSSISGATVPTDLFGSATFLVTFSAANTYYLSAQTSGLLSNFKACVPVSFP